MTAPSITLQAAGPGKAASHDVFALTGRTCQVAVYKFVYGSDAPGVAGDDISAIWDDFKEVLAIIPSQVDLTAADRRDFTVDLTTQVLVAFKAFNTIDDADASGVADVRLTVIGIV